MTGEADKVVKLDQGFNTDVHVHAPPLGEFSRYDHPANAPVPAQQWFDRRRCPAR